MKLLQFISILIVFLISTAGVSNNKLDSLKQIIESNHPDFPQEDRVTTLLKLSAALDDQSNSIKFIDEAIDLSSAIGDNSLEIEARKYKGLFLFELGAEKEALNEFYKTIKLCDTYDEPLKKALLHLIIANIKRELGHDDYLIYLKKSQDIYVDKNNPLGILKVTKFFGEIHEANGDYILAKSEYLKMIVLSEKVNDALSNWYGKIHLAKVFSRLGDKDSAEYYINSSYDEILFNSSPRNIIGWYLARAQIHENFGEYSEAFKMAGIALAKSNVLNSVNNEKESLKIIIRTSKASGDYKSAFEAKMLLSNIGDSVHKYESKKEYEKYQTLFEIGQKETALKLAEAKNREFKKEAETQGYRMMLFITVGITFLFALIIGLLYYKRKRDLLKSKIDQRDQYISRLASDMIEKKKVLKKANRIIKGKDESSDSSESEMISSIHYQDTFLDEELANIEQSFFLRLEELYPELTDKDKKVCALIRTNKSSKDIADILSLSSTSVDTYRSRIRKKMNLKTGESLNRTLKKI